MTVDKQKLRTVFLRKRKMLSDNVYDEKNARLFYYFTQFAKKLKNNIVHTFLPISEQKEVDTWPMLKYMQSLSHRIVLSKSNTSKNELTHLFFENTDNLKMNKWGILEPTAGLQIEPKQLDMILIPLIIFDRIGNRIGYGKGYYDKFLSECTTDCLKVGLSLSPPVDKIRYTEMHDVKLDYCITPIGVYDFKKK